MNRTSYRTLFAIALNLFALAAAKPLLATDYIWQNLLNWNDPNAWSPMGFPNAAGDTATFNATASVIRGVTLNGGTFTVGTISLLGHNNGGYFIQNGTLQLAGAAAINVETFNSLFPDFASTTTLALQANSTFHTVFADSTLSLAGGISGGFSINVTGLGTTSLTHANTYTGGTTLSGGTLLIGNDTALGTGTLTINGGTTFGITSSSFIANPVVVNGDFSIQSSNVLGFQGPIDLGGGARTITGLSTGNGNNVQFNGVISNGTGLTFLGTQLTAFAFRMGGAASNTYTGTTVVGMGADLALEKSGGAIAIPGNLTVQDNGFVTFRATGQIAAASTITLNTGNIVTIVDITVPNNITLTNATTNNQFLEPFATTFTASGVISGGGALVQGGDSSGVGTLVLNNNANSYTGGTFLNADVLFADANHALGTGTLYVAGGTTLGSHVNGTNLPNPVEVDGDFTITPSAGGSILELSGNVNLSGATRTITNGTDLSDVVLSGSISNGGLTLTSSGMNGSRFFMNGNTANTYTGLTTVQNHAVLVLDKTVTNGTILGNLVINNTGGVGIRQNEQIADTATVTINSGGGLTLAGHTETIGDLEGDGDLLLNDGGGGPGGTFIIGAGHFSGLIHDDGESGNIVKTGPGTLILDHDNTYNGFTHVDGGVLAIGALNAMGMGNVTVSGGTLQTFNGPRPMAVGGNYLQGPNGTLRLQIGGLDSGSESDYLTVTGSATLAGTLSLVRLNNFSPPPGSRVDIIGDLGGHVGEFDNVVSDFPMLFQPTVHYDEALDIYITFDLGSFAAIEGLTPNQRAVAHQLNHVMNDPGAADLIDFLVSEPFENLPEDYDLIAPEELASIYEISFSQSAIQNMNLQHRMDDIRAGSTGFSSNGYSVTTSGQTRDATYQDGKTVLPATDRSKEVMAPAPDNRWGVWVTGSGNFVNVGDNDDNAHGYDITTGDVLIGIDYRLGDHFAIGIDGGYTSSSSDLVDHGRIETDGGRAGIYATLYGLRILGSLVHVDAAVHGGWNNYDTRRTGLDDLAMVGAYDDIAYGDTDSSEFDAVVAYGADWFFGMLDVGTWSMIQYSEVNLDGFTESGSLAPLHFPDQDEDSIRSSTGVRLAYNATCGRTLIRPELRAAWQHDSGDRAYPIRAEFASAAGDIFTVHGPKVGRDAALVDAGLSILWNPRFSTYIYYDGILGRSNYDNNAVSGGFRFNF